MVCGLIALACKTDMVAPIDLTTLENGGYLRTVSPYPVVAATFNYSLANMSGTKMEILAEAVTPNKGANFANYDFAITFIDKTPANGTKTGTSQPLKSVPASAFAKDPLTGYPRATIAITGAEALTASKALAADVSVGDYFDIVGTIKLTDGKSFTTTNTGLNITGGAFYSSPFFYRVNVIK